MACVDGEKRFFENLKAEREKNLFPRRTGCSPPADDFDTACFKKNGATAGTHEGFMPKAPLQI